MTAPVFRPLTARDELALQRDFPKLVPWLAAQGLEIRDAVAVAHNATLLWHVLEQDPPIPSPKALLDRFSLAQIAELCRRYRELESGDMEWGFNPHFEEVEP